MEKLGYELNPSKPMNSTLHQLRGGAAKTRLEPPYSLNSTGKKMISVPETENGTTGIRPIIIIQK